MAPRSNAIFGLGGEVGLVGLKATALNGRRRGRVVASVEGAETPKEGCVAVSVDGPAKAKSVKPVNLKAGPSTCGGCGKPGALSKCASCMQVAYCSKSCQVQHWKKGGHKRECKQLKQTATLMYQTSRTNFKVCTPGGSASCFICLGSDGDGDDEPCPTPLGCACRGNAGFGHPGCSGDGRHYT